MSTSESYTPSSLRKEAILFGVLFLVGLLLLPLVIFVVGKAVFGGYGDGGLFDFLRALFGRLFAGDASAYFLILSPYLLWQSLRLTAATLRRRPPTA